MQDFFDNGPDNSDLADADISMLSAGRHGNTSSEAGDLGYDRHSKENNNGDPDSSSEDSESSSNSESGSDRNSGSDSDEDSNSETDSDSDSNAPSDGEKMQLDEEAHPTASRRSEDRSSQE